MPIRRAPATPEKSTSAAAEKDPEGSSEELPSAEDEQAPSSAAAEESEAPAEPTENGEENGEDKANDEATTEEKEGDGGEDGGEKKELKDGYKYEKSKVKKVKRTIPAWASVAASKKHPVTNYAGTHNKVDNILIEALTTCNERSGVSYQSVMKYIMKKYPIMDEKKFLIRKAMKKHLEKGTIKQLKGKGLSGTFAIGKQTALTKKNAQNKESLGDALPLIITRLCEPKEASYIMIKKYLEQHFPSLNVENRPDVLKSALVRAVERGQLEQITGKGANGTFQLKRTGSKVLLKGGPLEDAITAAITAMNEPKTCSTTTLRKYLVDANKDRKEYHLVSSLRRTLTKCKVLGWMEQITGHGFTGTYQLSFPYYPSPTILYPEKYKETPKKNTAAPAKRRRTVHSSDEEESEEEEDEEDDESEEEVAPSRRTAQKRPPPKARRPPPQKKSRPASQSKAKGRQVAKKSPAKKTASPAKKTGRKTAASKKKAAPKATPVKKAAPARKPKTPAVKKLSKRGSKQPESEEPSSDEAPATKSPRGGAKRSQPQEPEDKPAAKKQATKGRRSKAEETPVKEPAPKPAAKGKSKTPARKSKRGRH